ncbi:MAG: type IX secretion system membrane protein PorP/SprF [Cyclobacteriaceae bacterium]|nr:MAG: type IX secretion system membrane protein PorP/SprF [Cyclobacteriaceae bacterium]
MRILAAIFCTVVVLSFTQKASAQQYPVFTQYYFNELVINPAFAGSHVQLSLTSTYRNQWVNFPGAPRTVSFSGHTALMNGKMGVGLLVNHDEIGSYGNEHVYGYYSYRINMQHATLSMGLMAGFNFLGVDFSNLDLQDPTDASFLPINEFKPNFGTGIYYNRKNFFAGFSVPFLLNNAVSADLESVAAEIREARYYFLRSGGIFPINRAETVKLNPSILLRAQEGQPLSMDINLGVVIHDILSTGVSWRSGDSFITFIDLKLSEKFHFAYSYDWTTSDIARFSNGSHEFMINYRAKVTTAHKNLNCPTYFHYR